MTPRPGSRAWGSGTTSGPVATKRSRLDFSARSLQPTHVRTGMLPGYACFNCSERAVIPG